MPITISLTLTDDEAAKMQVELTNLERPSPDLLVELPLLIQHQVIQPVVRRQQQYRVSGRVEKLVAMTATQLVEVDKTIDAQRADTKLDVLASSVPESL